MGRGRDQYDVDIALNQFLVGVEADEAMGVVNPSLVPDTSISDEGGYP